MGYLGHPPDFVLSQLNATVDDLIRKTPGARDRLANSFSGSNRSASGTQIRTIGGDQGPYSYVSKNDTCDPSDAAWSRERPPISICMGPAAHLNHLKKEGWTWGACTYQTSRIPLRTDETIHVSWAHKKIGGIPLLKQPKSILVATRADVYSGAPQSAPWENCNVVAYRKIDFKTGRIIQGFNTIVANEGRRSGHPVILLTEDGEAYDQLPTFEYTHAAYESWKPDASGGGQEIATREASTRGRN